MAVKASEIESYKGDSALAGGYGSQGTQNVISGVWKMTDAVNGAFELLRAQQFQKSQREYEQRIRDRDELADMIASDKLNVDKLSDEDRLNANDKIQELRNSLIDAAKNGKVSDDKNFLELKKKYAEIAGGINNKNVNNIAIEADRKKYENQFDEGYEKHDAKERELMAKDPNHKYRPYVPLFQYDEKVVFAPIITDKNQKNIDAFQVETTETPNIPKTFDDVATMYTTPNGRKQIESAYNQIMGGSETSALLLDNVNKKLEEIALTLPEEQRALLKPIDLAVDNKPTVIAKQRIAMGWSKLDTKPKVAFINDTYAQAWKNKKDTDENIRQNEASAKNARDLEVLITANDIKLEKVKASLENSKKQFEANLQKGKDGSKGSKKMTEEQSKLLVQTYNAIEKRINENGDLTDNEKTLELQKLKEALDSGTTYQVGDATRKGGLTELVNTLVDLVKKSGVSTSETKVEKTNSKKPEWTGEFDSKGNMIFK